MEKAMRVTGSGILVSSSVWVIAAVILMLLLIVIIILIACKFKPWRPFISLSASVTRRRSSSSIKADDIDRPLILEDPGLVESQNYESASSDIVQRTGRQTQDCLRLTHSISGAPKQRLQPPSPRLTQSDSFVLNIPNSLEDSLVGLTLKHPVGANQFTEEQVNERINDENHSQAYVSDKDIFKDFLPTRNANLGSTILLEVISGPSRGLQYSIQSTNPAKLPVSIGRMPPCDIVLKDSEVSGKHAMINWNANKLKWELIDLGSMNGTILNSKTVNFPQSGSRHWSDPVELSSGDIITFGASSKISVHIRDQTVSNTPFGIGVASDPMALRRGGKKLPMEDVCYYKWPLPGLHQFGLFGIFDGHGGADAATSVSKIMPEVITGTLSNSFRREKVLSRCDASDVLREAFCQTEARINHYYEGCTATVILVWADHQANFYVQCANVGDSACVVNIEGKQIKMTEDHRITSYTERLRIQALGSPLRDGETRICGINLARMLGDKFLKEQDSRFSSEPYISEVTHISNSSDSFALLASDGFWDVVNIKKAVQLVRQTMETMERGTTQAENSAEKVANLLLSEARTLRTKDNTSIIFLDFTNKIHSCKLEP